MNSDKESEETIDIEKLYAETIVPDMNGDAVCEDEGTDRIGKYIILDEVGAGGMGKVFRAYDTELNRKVALKIIESANENLIKRFLLEAKATSQLTHPNIIPIHDLGIVGEKFYYTMKLIKGVSLKEIPDSFSDSGISGMTPGNEGGGGESVEQRGESEEQRAEREKGR